MKYKILPFLSLCLFVSKGLAQSVGINTDNPKSTLEVVNLNGNNGLSKSFRVVSTSSNEYFTILDDGSLGINNPSPKASLDINSVNDNSFVFSDYSENYKHDFLISRYNTGGAYSNANAGGQFFFLKRTEGGVYLGPKSNVPSGFYTAANDFTGISLDKEPKTFVEVGGNVRVGNNDQEIKLGSKCSLNRLAYSKGHFYGCNNDTWQQIDND
ncbi:hypothetical protein MWN41_04115 [Ornithobacterium rhinotracheale]|uniref:hypothetical protein n=1 Tax=Ornithobacterium rhinotracheale TaxID=28251 RepID=UPI001FF582B8|nr:hypothetical protein [Ornithobacterium rhinotracheale]MCK0202203.1 hypothetical protein [Ornithobacterium rhinotracheale]